MLCVDNLQPEIYSVDINENNGEGSSGSNYNWEVEEPTFVGTIIPITNTGNQVKIDWLSPPGLYTLIVEESSELGCINRRQLRVELQTPPTLDIQSVNEVCEGNPITLEAIISGALGVEWSTSGDGIFENNTTNTTYIPGSLDVLNGSVQITAETSQDNIHGCEPAKESHTIEIYPSTTPIFTINTNYCFGDIPAPLPRVSDNDISGHWSEDHINTQQVGNKIYTFTPIQNCATIYHLEITVAPCDCVINQTEIVEVCQGDELILIDGTMIDTENTGIFIHEIVQEIPNDCDIVTTYQIKVSGPKFPNVFTPINHDGINDKFKIIDSICEVSDYRLTIYNRWGNKVFETNQPNEAWEGSFENNILPGSYIWYVEYSLNEKQFTRKGAVQIIE